MGTCFENAMERKRKFQENGKKLNGLISLPFEEKLRLSLNTIRNATEYKRPVIASSFGKDSTVLTHLVHKIDNTIPIVFTNTGVNFKETIQYMKFLKELWDLKVYELHPERKFWQVVKEFGYPKRSRNSKTGDSREPKCCKILKHEPMLKFIQNYKPGMVFVGLLGDEGRQRRWAYIFKGGPIYKAEHDNVMKCIPLIWWTTRDIWHYLRMNNIPINPAYEKYGIERTGCIPCTGFIHWEKEMIKVNPKMYRKVQHDLGQNLIEDYTKPAIREKA